MPEVVVLLSSGTFAASLFSYLRYRNYTRLMRHVIETLGVDGLKAVDRIAPPSRTVQITKRTQTGQRRQREPEENAQAA